MYSHPRPSPQTWNPSHPSPHKLLPSPSYHRTLQPVPSVSRRQISLIPARIQKYSYATKPRKCDTLKSSKVQQMVQCRLTVTRKTLCGNVEWLQHGDYFTQQRFLMSASRRSSFLFVLSSSVALTTAGLPQTASSTTAVTPQQGAPSLRYYFRKI